MSQSLERKSRCTKTIAVSDAAKRGKRPKSMVQQKTLHHSDCDIPTVPHSRPLELRTENQPCAEPRVPLSSLAVAHLVVASRSNMLKSDGFSAPSRPCQADVPPPGAFEDRARHILLKKQSTPDEHNEPNNQGKNQSTPIGCHSHTYSTQVLPDQPSRRDLAPPGPGFASRRFMKGKGQSTQ